MIASSYNTLKKNKIILSSFNLLRFAVRNRKLIQEMCLSTIWNFVQGALRKKQLLGSFVERFNGRSRKKLSFAFLA